MFTRVTIERCRLYNWKYDAIHIQSDDIDDQGNRLFNHKNCNGWRVVACRIEGGGRHGIFAMGENANAGKTATLSAAILDRLAMHALRIDIDGPSYRQHVAHERATGRGAKRTERERAPRHDADGG